MDGRKVFCLVKAQISMRDTEMGVYTYNPGPIRNDGDDLYMAQKIIRIGSKLKINDMNQTIRLILKKISI